MNTPQLLTGAVLLAVAVSGCSRDRAEQEAREAAVDVRDVAERAGERVADSWLTTKIQAQYFADDDIKARYVNVSTRDAVVTLTGYVDNEPMRQEAVQIARNTDGVREVHDQLQIGRSAAPSAEASATPAQPGDATPADSPAASGAIATSGEHAGDAAPPNVAASVDDSGVTSLIQARYFLDPVVKMRHIEVQAQDGVVTLTGAVASEAERQQALLLARTTDGVQRVEDHLSIDAALASGGTATVERRDALPEASVPSAAPAVQPPGRSAPAVRQDGAASLSRAVEAKLAADPQLASTSITVTADNGVVTLQGVVPSAAARQRALALARETSGAAQVIDRLRVSRQ
jgi:osmotically-inducible protein OsmY